MTNIIQAATHYIMTRERLLADYPALAEDQSALLDTLDGETNFDEVVVSFCRSAKEDKAYAEACKKLAAEYVERARLLMTRHENKRDIVAKMMIKAEKLQIKSAYATISARKREPIPIIYAQSELPEGYMIEEIIPEQTVKKPDMDLIAQALADGFKIPGARMEEQTPVVTVREK